MLLQSRHGIFLLLLLATIGNADGGSPLPPSGNTTLVALSDRTGLNLRQNTRKLRGLQTGTCGGGSIGNGICPDGTCCSQFGWCGTTPEHCDHASSCGQGSVGNGVCLDGSCCSQFGWCGTTADHCGSTNPPTTQTQVTGLPTPVPSSISTQAPTPKTTEPPLSTPMPSNSESTSSPTSQPTIIPMSTPMPSTSSSPTSQPTIGGPMVNFTGIINAYSINKGIIEVLWDGSLLEDGSFDVFVALGEYDFNAMLASMSVNSLIDAFANETSFQHFTFNDTDSASIESLHYEELHTLLVIAQVEGVYSSNRDSRKVVVSSMDPHVRDDINVVGMFVPTPRWTISMEDAPEGTEHSLEFSGAVSLFAQDLEVSDYITGLTTDIRPFVRRVVEVTLSTPDVVMLRVVHARMEEIFDKLDIDGGFELSGKMNASPGRRRLGFFDSIAGFVGGAVQAIGDSVVGFVEDVAETIAEVAGGEVLEEFNLVDIKQAWEYELSAEVNNTGASATLNVMGEVHFLVALFARIRIAGPVPVYAEVGAKVQYSAEASMEMSAGIGAEYEQDYTIWEGRTLRRVIVVGVVPVELYAQPKLELQIRAEASLEVSSKLGASAKGGTEVSVIYEGSIRQSFVPPNLETDYMVPTIEKKVSLEASAAIVLSLDAGVYGGLLTANIGISAGISAQAVAGVETVGDTVIVPTIETFDLSIGFTIPFSASAFYGELELVETTLFEKKWPILTLPSLELEILSPHVCVQGSGNSGAAANLGIRANQDYPSDAFIGNAATQVTWYIDDSSGGWFIREELATMQATLGRDGLVGFSPQPDGTVTVVMQPVVPPLLKIVKSFSLQELVSGEGVECTAAGPCDDLDGYFDRLAQEVGTKFNSEIFLSYQPDPSLPRVPSTVYKFEDFMGALKKLQNVGDNFQFWLGDDCSAESQKAALVNMAAFLGQSMRETIIYDACDENNWDSWRADIFKEPTSPPENLSALYPMSSGCGQLGQKYADYTCDDECPVDLSMEMTATTNAGWIGAPPPLFCGPKSKYDGLGYWNPQQLCKGADNTCDGQPFFYPGQTAGVSVLVSEDSRFPDVFYTNPLPDASGISPPPRSPGDFPATNVEGCCWWGRGVIQTTGRCNFGKLNKYLGAGAGSNALYPDINFCQNPQSICNGPSDLKWVAGIFFWVSDIGPQAYNKDGFDFQDGVKQFVSMGCADNVDQAGCDFLFEYASGIVNRGCHDPGTNGCPNCVPGATCGPAHHVPERVEASKQALRALMQTL